MRYATLIAVLLVVAGCKGGDKGKSGKPAGTPTDPVQVCERPSDACSLGGGKVGVCVASSPEMCGPGGPCFICAPQH